jgi:NhaP-type Na+/H+ or K+/H+ antiporter
MYETLAVLAIFAFLYSAVADRLEKTPVSGPLVFLAFGVVAGPLGFGFLHFRLTGEGLRTAAELTLALVLFTDAAHANLPALRSSYRVPQRLLLVGLPLTILAGFGAARLLFPALTLLEAALLATILAPTDAALGEAVVTNRAVPARIREDLNVESGLNDGICVPILLTFLALATERHGGRGTLPLALGLVAEEIGIGLAAGVGLTLLASLLLRFCAARGWIAGAWARLTVVALALAAFALAQVCGGSGFIACFAGGLIFGSLTHRHKAALLAGAESTGSALGLITWVAFGAAVVDRFLGSITAAALLYALLSLTLVRMVPVFLSLAGLGLPADAKLFIGWFGPRGLASIVFGVIVMNEGLPGSGVLATAIVCTVVLSILAHGLSANPLAAAYARQTRH